MTWSIVNAVSPPARATSSRITMAMGQGKRLPSEMMYLTWYDPPPWFMGGNLVTVAVGDGDDAGSLRISSGGKLRVTQMPCPGALRIVSCGVRLYRWDSVPKGTHRSTVVEFTTEDGAVVIKLPVWTRPVEDDPPAASQVHETDMLWSPQRIDVLRHNFDNGMRVSEIVAALNAQPGPHISQTVVENMIQDAEMKRPGSPPDTGLWTEARELHLTKHWPRGTTISIIQSAFEVLKGSEKVPTGAEIIAKAREMGLARPKYVPNSPIEEDGLGERGA